MKNNNVTIHDISKALEIDSSTVSRALNNSPRVSQKTKDKILSKAQELGYQRNSLASKLRTNKTHSIGVIVPRISRHFFSSVIAGIEETAFEAGYDVIICQSLDDFEREKKLMDTLLSNRVDGVLISVSMQTTSYDHFKEYQKQGFPILFFDRPCILENTTNVIIDDYKISFEATEHLIREGYQNIVHFSGPQHSQLYQNRTNGYKDALENNQIPIREQYIFESYLMKEDGIAMAQKILQLPEVDAVFSSNDTSAISAMQYLKEKGIRIPEDIAFVGFSNEPVSAVIEPSLTTVKQPDFEMGKVSASLLFEQINCKPSQRIHQTKILEPELIIRNSSKKTS
ncbi:LacI family DNA-binding transcriptional regulator [Flavobacterium sp. UMI-01]|uniref:LacI family DNA-binding transcriptional regulator n=1 Tax=Flavobacterium sp. UMI-01 TaxID=1441053 RepID=UPI001C7CE789|nr:LacI family DNA-binding transcriptional regulator [Flavobacterium sp. UMI-01]GIZ09297.1 LacI family transcriptional regulator [Flavobacterium sp. UMI-01]